MASTDDPTPEPGSDRFERLATRIGDLDSPFYEEERQRDVWNEASAVGFQLMLWGTPLVAAACLWVAGAPAMPYAAALLAPWALACLTTLSYARRREVDPGDAEAPSADPVRAGLYALLMAAVASGFMRAAAQLGADSSAASFLRGAAQGGAAAFIGVAAVAIFIAGREAARRRAGRA